jgi:hypothetical protein
VVVIKLKHARSQALVAVVFAILAVRLFRLTSHYAVNIFFWDQWDIQDAALFEHHSLWEIFRFQHGPHRQGLGGLLAALVEPWFRWNSRTEAFVATAIVVMVGLCMLYLKSRLFGAITWTDVVIPIIVFTPAQWESAWTAVNFAHGTLPVLLIVVYCTAWTWQNERLKYGLITALNFVTIYTGFGLFLGLLTPLLLLVKFRQARGKRIGLYLLICVAISIVSLASFFWRYQNDDASGCVSLLDAAPTDYLQFFCLMFIAPFGQRGLGLLSTLAGGVVVAGVVVMGALAWKRLLRSSGAIDTVLATLSAYTLLFCVAAALGRTCTGLEDAHASRYSDYKELFVLALYFWTLTMRKAAWFPFPAVTLPLLVIPSLFLTGYDADTMQELYKLKSGWRACYLAGKPISVCDEANGPLYPDNQRTHLQRKIEFLRQNGQNLFAP